MRETSRLAPGTFLYFLQADDTHADRLSILRRKGEGITTTVFSRLASSSISISMNGVEAETIYSGVETVWYPMAGCLKAINAWRHLLYLECAE